MHTKTEPLSTSFSFHEAVKQKKLLIIESYLNSTPDLVNTPDERGITPLSYAAESGDIDLTRLFLQHTNPLTNLSHIDLAYKAHEHSELRKYLRQQFENKYESVDKTREETLQKKQAQMVLAANLSLYFHYSKDDFNGLEPFSKKELDYIIQAEQLFDEIVQEYPLTPDELINLHLKMGKVCGLLQLNADVIKHYDFVINKQTTLLKNQNIQSDHQKVLLENLSSNLIILIKAHLKRGASLDPSSSSISNKYACEHYFKALEITDSIPEHIPPPKKLLISYYRGLACRYIGECFEIKGNSFAESLEYYLKAIRAHSNTINSLSSSMTKEHMPIIQELARGYRRAYSLYQKGLVNLTDIQTGLKNLELDKTEKIISTQKANFQQNENLIPEFYQAYKNICPLLEKISINAKTPFWNTSNDDSQTTTSLKESTASNSSQLNG